MAGKLTARAVLSLSAIMVFGALFASAAGAADFHTDSSPTYFKGGQTEKAVFSFNGGKVKCGSAELTSGRYEGTSLATVSLHPTYSECTAFGQGAEVSTAGCNYELTAASSTSGALSIACEAGKAIVITTKTSGCTVTIGSQAPATPTVAYANEAGGAAPSVLVSPNVAGLTYKSSGGVCGTSGSNGQYSGAILTKGYGTSTFIAQHGIAVGTPLPAATRFHAESSPSWVRGSQATENVFTFNGGTIKCSNGAFTSGEVAGTSFSTLTVTPAYSGCTAFGSQVTFEANGCAYALSAGAELVGYAEIICPSGKEIVITRKTAGCSWRIGSQTPAQPRVDYANTGSGSTRGVLVTSGIEGVAYTSSGGLCGASGTNGKFTGSIDARAYDSAAFAGQHGIWVQ
jgi:hypothetical protein